MLLCVVVLCHCPFFLVIFCHMVDWVSERQGVSSSTDSEWLPAPPLIISPRQMDNTKIAQNWQRQISAFSFMADTKIKRGHFCILNFGWHHFWLKRVLTSQSWLWGGQPGILIESSTKFYHSMLNALILSLNTQCFNFITQCSRLYGRYLNKFYWHSCSPHWQGKIGFKIYYTRIS